VKAITKSRRASADEKKNSLLGTSLLRLSGFRICTIVDKQSSETPSVEGKILKELLYSKGEK
jgi:hypothetical protein